MNYFKRCVCFSVVIVLFVILLEDGLSLLINGRLRLNDHNDPNNFAALLFLPLCVSIDELLKRKNFYLFIVATISLLLILLTGSRGGLLACLFFFVMYFWFHKGYRKAWVWVVICLFLLFAPEILRFILPEDTYLRLFDIDSYKYQLNYASQTQTQRLSIWKITFSEIIVQKPLLGFGSGTAPLLLTPYYGFDEGVHNTYLNFIVEYGFIGFLIFLSFLITLLKMLHKRGLIFEVILLIGMLVVIMFLDSYAKKFFWNVLLFCAISLRNDKPMYLNNDLKTTPGKKNEN